MKSDHAPRNQDVDQLFGFLRNKELGEDVVKKALEIIGHLHQHLQAQEHLVQAVLSVRGSLTMTQAHALLV